MTKISKFAKHGGLLGVRLTAILLSLVGASLLNMLASWFPSIAREAAERTNVNNLMSNLIDDGVPGNYWKDV